MKEDGTVRSRGRWIPALFFVYLAITLFGWICLLINDDTVMTLVRHLAWLLLTISAGLALAAGAAWLIWNAVRRGRGVRAAGGKKASMAVITFVLLPFFGVAVLGATLTVPFWVSDWMTPERAKTLRSAKSPDGQWTAYVINRPRFDAFDHQLYLRHAGESAGRRVARLRIESDPNHAIQWSPRGDLVVFTNRHELYALRLADMQSAVAALGGHKVTRPDGTYFIDGKLAEVREISFPRAGGVRYTLKGSVTVKTIPPEAFQQPATGGPVYPFPPAPGEGEWLQWP